MGGAPVPTHVLYLHGFRSSPRSFKAQAVQAWLAEHRPDVRWWCPQLPPSPREAMTLVTAGIVEWPDDGGSVVLGSSLGGFYATWIARQRPWPAVVMNPAVDPARDLAAYIGEQTAFHDPAERFFFRAEFIEELRQLTLPGPQLQPDLQQRLMAVIAQGDEVLDWREMSQRYHGATLRIVSGSDHALSDFDQHLPHILQFLKLADPPSCD